jgi:hypothetical protein
MSGYKDLNVCEILPSVSRRTPKIMLQRVEEMLGE